MMRKFLGVVLVLWIGLVLVCGAVTAAESGVRVWEEPLVLPTYEVGEPDKNPRFYAGRAYQGAQGRVYPYAMWDDITERLADREYTALYLENEYLKICVLPELGGRVFSALDKTNNYDFFYRQTVIKPVLIGMAGAWLAGGIEWNIPHHHRASSYFPVDYHLEEHPDGSKTIWVGEMELRHRMNWVVGLTLHPGRSYMEATIRISNGTPFVHSLLCWANVAVHTNNEYQVIFPPMTQFGVQHGKVEFARWPLSSEAYGLNDFTEGVDVSWWKNHPEWGSMFAHESREDFFAGYDHGKQAGVVHVGDHHTVPGKKFWTWGTGTRGQRWARIYTDSDGPYLELMVGAFSDNQPDYSWIQPYEVKVAKMNWYPIREIQGVKNATLDAAVNLELISEDTARVGFHSTEERLGATVLLTYKGSEILRRTIQIGPGEPFLQEVKLPAGAREQELRATLTSSDGEVLVDYQPKELETKEMPPVDEAPSKPEETVETEDLFLTGLRLEQFHNPSLDPEPFYQETLRRDPLDSRVNTMMGIRSCKNSEFEKAEESLKTAVSRAGRDYTRLRDAEPLYYLGVALRALGREQEATDAFSRATWDLAFRSPAHYQLAELACREGDFVAALAHLEKSLGVNSSNVEALTLKVVVLRKLDRANEAEQLANDTAAQNPLSFWVRNELVLLGEKEWVSVAALLRDEVQSYLEIAVRYGNSGFWKEAIQVLRRAVDGSNASLNGQPMIFYYLAHYYSQQKEPSQSREWLERASQQQPDLCFPFRLESIPVLEEAQELNPHDALAPYLLGNLLYELQPSKAILAWEKSRELDDSYATVHRNLGLGYAQVENDTPKAIRSLEEAVRLEPEDPRLYYELDLLYAFGRVAPEKRLALLEANQETVKLRDDALSQQISLYVQTKQYDRALEILGTHQFHVWEGEADIHDVYVDAHLLRGLENFRNENFTAVLSDFRSALEYPENLEVGAPLHPRRYPQIYCMIGHVLQELDRGGEAREFFQKAVDAKQIEGISEMSYYRGVALESLGRREEAEDVFQGLIQAAESDLTTEGGLDFFAKFGEKESRDARFAQARYIRGLGYLGQGQLERAKQDFTEAVALNPNHVWARAGLEALD